MIKPTSMAQPMQQGKSGSYQSHLSAISLLVCFQLFPRFSNAPWTLTHRHTFPFLVPLLYITWDNISVSRSLTSLVHSSLGLRDGDRGSNDRRSCFRCNNGLEMVQLIKRLLCKYAGWMEFRSSAPRRMPVTPGLGSRQDIPGACWPAQFIQIGKLQVHSEILSQNTKKYLILSFSLYTHTHPHTHTPTHPPTNK